MTIDSSDSRFWQASIVDGYYICSNTSEATDYCLNADETYYQEYQEASSDWVTPFSDDDWSDPWCTSANIVGDPVSSYQCTHLKCYMERPFDTGNTDYDWLIAPFDNGGTAWYDEL